MKTLLALLALLTATLLTIPATAQIAYDNGPVNGQVDAWTLNFGYAVSNSFTMSGATGPVTGVNFWAWLMPGDVLSSIEVSIGTQPFDSFFFDGVVNLTSSDCFVNGFGYDVCMETANFFRPALQSGNYWITLQNAVVPSGDPVYWDENSGAGCQSPGCPSQAQESTVGTIPSEAFTINALDQGVTTGTTPEPVSIVLLGSGVFALAGVLRRKMF